MAKRSKKTASADVVIVGGGITGLISAHMLSKAGKKVILFEKKELGSGATKDTSAFLTQVIDTSIVDLEKVFGFNEAKAILDSHGQAIDAVEHIVIKEKIDCDFVRCSNFEYANTKRELKNLKKEFEKAQKLALDVVFHPEEINFGFKNAGGIEFRNQAKFSAEKFVKSLGKTVKKNGVKIFENTKVKNVDPGEKEVKVETDLMNVHAKWAIIATYEPFNKPLNLYFKKGFYTSYIIQLEVPKDSIKEAIYEDSKDPYHYLRLDKGKNKDYLLLGGEDHRSDIPVSKSKSFKALKDYADQILSVPYKVKTSWTGPILEPVDGLAFVGPIGDRKILYAMAFSGNGMTYSAIASQIFLDAVLGRKNEWLDIYHADRIPTLRSLMVKGRDYTKEFFGGAVKNTF